LHEVNKSPKGIKGQRISRSKKSISATSITKAKAAQTKASSDRIRLNIATRKRLRLSTQLGKQLGYTSVAEGKEEHMPAPE